jgi:hypothetical protein
MSRPRELFLRSASRSRRIRRMRGSSSLTYRVCSAVAIFGGVLYVIDSLSDWEKLMGYSFTGRWSVLYGRTEWHGVGVLAGIVALALLATELFRAFSPTADRSVENSRNFWSTGLAVSLLVLTILVFESDTSYRYWPAWAGFAISAVLVAASLGRAAALSQRPAAAARPRPQLGLRRSSSL